MKAMYLPKRFGRVPVPDDLAAASHPKVVFKCAPDELFEMENEQELMMNQSSSDVFIQGLF
ncbi:hypothetical protein [Paenibacillus polymyxa]|jgi:hypothetical protein|uniref:Uncharacterized protein n=3 Tax=Paenibacillus TaxID=44249 RepID=A0AAP4E9J5_PAEPO|nr:hypothetical protein [Paenibacillus polymyxa]MDH2329929.1 hypothetical protein [Paenibacillus polymyxa]